MEGKSYRYFNYTDPSRRPRSFAIPDDVFRNHLYLRQIDYTGPENTYTVWFDAARGTRDALRIVEDKQCDIILPTPGFSHIGVGFHLMSSSDILIEDCDIREGAQFVGAIKGNNGALTFNRVKMCTEDEGSQP